MFSLPLLGVDSCSVITKSYEKFIKKIYLHKLAIADFKRLKHLLLRTYINLKSQVKKYISSNCLSHFKLYLVLILQFKRRLPIGTKYINLLEQPHQHSTTDFSSKSQPRSYANVTEGHQPLKPNPTSPNNNEGELLKFLNEFKAILNPLIALLTTVLTNLTKFNNAN